MTLGRFPDSVSSQHGHNTTPDRNLILFFIGCEEPRAKTPQLPPKATAQTETTDTATEQATTPASATAPTAPAAQANEVTGKVVHIIDGDTIDILTADKTTIRIRLNGIDTPETVNRSARMRKSSSVNSSAGRLSEL